MEAYNEALKALKANDLNKAEEGFARAAASEFVFPQTRKDAAAQLALVKQRRKAAAAADKSTKPVKPVAKPAAKPAAKAKPKPKPAKKDVEDAKAKKLLDDMQARRNKALQLLAAGRNALDNNEPEKAARYFDRALALAPDLLEAKRQLNFARQQTGAVSSAGALSRLERNRRIAKQEADVEFAKAIKRSQEALAAAEDAAGFDAAADAALVARNILETNKSLYPAEEYREKLKLVEDQTKWAAMRREEWEKTQVRKQQTELVKAEAERVHKEREQRQRKLQTLTARARSLAQEHKYEPALEVLQQILRLDPKNHWAAERSELLGQFVVLQEERKADITQRSEEQRSILDIRWSEVPWYELLRYPRDWKEISHRRKEFGAGTVAESEADRVVRQRLRQKLQKLNFADIEFKDVVQFLRDVSGASIYVNWRALEAVGIDRSTTVNVHLADVSFEKALRIILSDVGGVTPLSFIVNEGVITVSTRDDLSRQTTTRVYDIRDLIVRVPNFVGPRMDLTEIGQEAAGDGGGGGEGLFGDEDEDEEDEENIPTKSEIITDIIDLIKSTIDTTSWRPEGDIGSIRELHGQLVVTQTAENHQELIQMLNKLREARALQIAIEARFILVSTGFLNSIGIDLDFFFNIGSRLGSGSVVDPFTGATVPTTAGVSGWGSGPPGDNNWTPMAVQQNSSTFTSMVGLESPVQGGIGGQITNHALSIAGTFLEDIQVDFLIRATQAHSSTRSLTAPRLTLFNGQRAYVTVATQRAYIADLTPVIAENAIAYDPTPAYVSTGTTLDVEATISADLRYVTLTVRPQVSTLLRFFNYAIEVDGTDAAGNPLTGTGFVQLPEVSVQFLETTVSVPDGGTLLLGGQKLAGEIEREMGVPLLSKVPIINRFFTNRGMIRDEQTLLILIKPKIIIHREEEQRQFP